MKKVIKPKNLDAFRIWFEKLGYQISTLKGKGFSARTNNRYIKKRHHYVLVTDSLGGNQAAFELGEEFEAHLASPDYLTIQEDGNGVLSFVA